MIDGKHAKMRKHLTKVRNSLDHRLQQISAASQSQTNSTLVDVLGSFETDVAKFGNFVEIGDDLVDNTIALSRARMGVWVTLSLSLVIAGVNYGLLYLFFDEYFAGLQVPYIGLEFAILIAGLFPILEFAAGIGTEVVSQLSAQKAVRVVIATVAAFIVLVLASFEFIIFHELFGGLFQKLADFPPGGVMQSLVSCVGPALTLMQALFGYGAGDNLLKLRSAKVERSIKEQVASANSFVADLPKRLSEISHSAAQAKLSVDELASQVRGRGDLDLPLATQLAEQRAEFQKAISSVNPTSWPPHVDGGKAEAAAIETYAWVLPLLAICIGVAFIWTFGSILSSSAALGMSGSAMGYIIATGTILACFASGSQLLDRVTISHNPQTEWKDALSPRDSLFKVVASVTMALVIAGILLTCIMSKGVQGIAVALLLSAIVGAVTWIGSYMDLLARGFSYLVRLLVYSFDLLATLIVKAVWNTLGAIAAAVVAITLFVAQTLALPLTLVVRAFQQRGDVAASKEATL